MIPSSSYKHSLSPAPTAPPGSPERVLKPGDGACVCSALAAVLDGTWPLAKLASADRTAFRILPRTSPRRHCIWAVPGQAARRRVLELLLVCCCCCCCCCY